ncbi:hypothetical protein CBR_g6453 [Chara braunii]|uniref:Uncharacterized protein n=1 Tax=Chara braunii TaxID=69332 RepID=A0A388KJT6_CHABU|nr:hypothetical protein CBR_g6453 [Chara braunii]|eukprot:GBG70325.1 hypothetical protein CBR_g6453 [Chara braunii]
MTATIVIHPPATQCIPGEGEEKEILLFFLMFSSFACSARALCATIERGKGCLELSMHIFKDPGDTKEKDIEREGGGLMGEDRAKEASGKVMPEEAVGKNAIVQGEFEMGERSEVAEVKGAAADGTRTVRLGREEDGDKARRGGKWPEKLRRQRVAKSKKIEAKTGMRDLAKLQEGSKLKKLSRESWLNIKTHGEVESGSMVEQASGVELQIDDARWPRPLETVVSGRVALDLPARGVSADAIESRWSWTVLGSVVHLWTYVIETFELDSQRWRRPGMTSIQVVGHIYYSREVLATVYFHGIVHYYWREEQSARRILLARAGSTRGEVERLHEGVRRVMTTLRIGGHFPYLSSRLRVTLPCFMAEELWGLRRLGEIYFAALDLDNLCRGYADRDWVLYAQFVAGPLVGERGLQLIKFLRAIVPTGSPDLYSMYQPLAFWTMLEREARRPIDHLAGVGQLLAETREERPGHLISTGEVGEYYQQVYPKADDLAWYAEDWKEFDDIDPWGDQDEGWGDLVRAEGQEQEGGEAPQEDGWGHLLQAEGQEEIPWRQRVDEDTDEDMPDA